MILYILKDIFFNLLLRKINISEILMYIGFNFFD